MAAPMHLDSALGVVVAHFVRGSFINDLGFLSLGLRAAALLLPLSLALWRPGRFTQHAVIVSMVVGTAATSSRRCSTITKPS